MFVSKKKFILSYIYCERESFAFSSRIDRFFGTLDRYVRVGVSRGNCRVNFATVRRAFSARERAASAECDRARARDTGKTHVKIPTVWDLEEAIIFRIKFVRWQHEPTGCAAVRAEMSWRQVDPKITGFGSTCLLNPSSSRSRADVPGKKGPREKRKRRRLPSDILQTHSRLFSRIYLGL